MPKRRETLFSYDVSGNITSVTDAQGNATSFTYDEQDRSGKQARSIGKRGAVLAMMEWVISLSRSIEGVNPLLFEYDALNRVVRKVLGE